MSALWLKVEWLCGLFSLLSLGKSEYPAWRSKSYGSALSSGQRSRRLWGYFLLSCTSWFRHVNLLRMNCENNTGFEFIEFILYHIPFCDIWISRVGEYEDCGVCSIVKAKRKGKVHRTADHEGPERKQIYSSFFTLGVRWRCVVNATPRPSYPPEERRSTHCTDGWVGPRVQYVTSQTTAVFRK